MGYFREAAKTYKALLKGEKLPEFDPSQLTGKQKERYEKNLAAQARAREEVAEGQRQLEQLYDAQDEAAILQGPALRERPPTADEYIARVESEGLGSFVKGEMTRGAGVLREVAKEAVGEFKVQPIDWDAQSAAQASDLPARTAARAPYRSAHAPAVTITRFATRGKSQLDDALAFLRSSGLAARPDLVHGIYRVPDRISPNLTPHSERGRLVEWEVVHHPGAAGTPAQAEVELVGFQRNERWFARRLGEPSVIDEDVGASYLSLAQIGPEHVFGMPRLTDFRAPLWSDNENTYLHRYVRGITVLHLPAAGAAPARERMVAEAPLPWGPPQVHLEVLDWDSLRKELQWDPWRPALAPSPHPHLPSTPQELLVAYLEVVGVQASDCYSAAVVGTRFRIFELAVNIPNAAGIQQPCVDGKARRRLHGAEHVVISYRDRAEYVEGRARWARYLAEVLHARLSHLTGARAPVALPEKTPGWAKALAVGYGILNPIEWLDTALERDPERNEVPFPYCWPPIDAPGAA